VVHYSAHPGQSPPSYAVRMKKHHPQKRLREMKRASWRLYCEQSPGFIENQAHKPLAHSSAADVVDRFICDVVLAVGQENQDRRSTISHMSVSNSFSQNVFVPFGTPVCIHDILCSLESTSEVRPAIGFKSQGSRQQLVGRACKVVFYRSRWFVIEEDQTIRIPSGPAQLGVAIYGSLAG
jgi:hypothetical protein